MTKLTIWLRETEGSDVQLSRSGHNTEQILALAIVKQDEAGRIYRNGFGNDVTAALLDLESKLP